MEFNRNQFFLLGLVLLFLGIQFRMVESFVLNEKISRVLIERSKPVLADAGAQVRAIMPAAGPTPRKTVKPPEWLGYALMSVGSVLVLHSLAMRKPGG